MTARPKILILAASLALAPALPSAGPRRPARWRGRRLLRRGRQPSLGGRELQRGRLESSPGYSGGSSSGSGSYSPSTAERRHPRAGTGSGSGGGYYPGYPGYPGWGGGGYYPGYWGSWWPYGSCGWYGG